MLTRPAFYRALEELAALKGSKIFNHAALRDAIWQSTWDKANGLVESFQASGKTAKDARALTIETLEAEMSQ